jgi:hypothetical protein
MIVLRQFFGIKNWIFYFCKALKKRRFFVAVWTAFNRTKEELKFKIK